MGQKELRIGVVMPPEVEEKLTALMWYKYGPTAQKKKGVTVKDCINLCYDC